MSRLRKPAKVNASIKFVRWSLLLCGVVYGRSKFNYYSSVQNRIRDEFDKMWPTLKARAKIEKYNKSRDELISTARSFGVDLPDDWTPPFN